MTDKKQRVYGILDDSKLESSICRTILKLKKEGILVGNIRETRYYIIKYHSFVSAASWQQDGESLFYVTDKRTEKKYKVSHCFQSALYSGTNNDVYYWTLNEEQK